MSDKTLIFLSSTYEDLKEHRQVLLRALASLKQEVEAMEYWRPTSSTPLNMSLQKVREADIYIGILGTRYGSVARDGKSITQLEYEEAARQNIERLVYLLDPDHHPVLLKHVDTKENARKLESFKETVSQCTRETFSSPGDLAGKVITHLIQYLDSIGKNVRSALKSHGVEKFKIKTGYSTNFSGSSIDISSLLSMPENGKFVLEDEYVESATAAALVSKKISDGNYSVLEGFATFEAEVWSILESLLKDANVESDSIAEEIKISRDPWKLRLLFKIVRITKSESCLEVICEKIMDSKNYHKIIRSYDLKVTPFDTVAIKSIKSIREGNEDKIREFMKRSKNQKKWRSKKVFEKSLR